MLGLMVGMTLPSGSRWMTAFTIRVRIGGAVKRERVVTRTRSWRSVASAVAGVALTLALAGCGQDAFDLPTSPLRSSEMLGTWSSDDAGTISFDASTVTLDDVPSEAVTGDDTAGATPIVTTGRWKILGNGTGRGWKTITVTLDSAVNDGGWVVRGRRGHRELDLMFGDPDQVEWYRYRHVSDESPSKGPAPTPLLRPDDGVETAGRHRAHS